MPEEKEKKIGIAEGPPIPIDPATTVDRLKVAQWLERHWHSPSRTGRMCPICSTTKWAISEDFTWMSAIGARGELQIGGNYFPFVIVTCTNCGNSIFFNALIMGLLPAKQPGK